MIYDWTNITNELITNLYLYGQATTPTNLVSDSIIRPADNTTIIGDRPQLNANQKILE